MAVKLARITQQPFGTSGPTGDFGQFGSKAANPSSPVFTQNPTTIQALPNFLDGWGAAIIGNYEPPLEDMNSLFLLAFYQLGYLLQEGIAEYDSGTTYFQYSICQYLGFIYQSVTNSNIGNTPSTSTTNWTCISSVAYGGTVASASSLTLPAGNSFTISGVTTINNITIQPAGSKAALIFSGVLTVATGGNILLNSGSFTTAANSTLVLMSNGTNWFELSRSPADLDAIFASNLNYGSSTSSSTPVSQNATKIARGNTISVSGGSHVVITNLPFASASSYSMVATSEVSFGVPPDSTDQNAGNLVAVRNSGSQATVYNTDDQTHVFQWIAIGT